MSSTGGKTSDKRLDPLTLSAESSVCQNPKSSFPKKPAQPAQCANSYAQRLQKEWSKVLGRSPTSQILQMVASETAPKLPVLELDIGQLCKSTPLKNHHVNEDCITPKSPAIKPPTEDTVTRPDISAKATTSGKFIAPRALPFSEESYIRVKVISQNLAGNETKETATTEKICWMQRDAIRHYLTVQDIEKRRAATKGAVYESFRHDV